MYFQLISIIQFSLNYKLRNKIRKKVELIATNFIHLFIVLCYRICNFLDILEQIWMIKIENNYTKVIILFYFMEINLLNQVIS
jgi:hypothetical protein